MIRSLSVALALALCFSVAGCASALTTTAVAQQLVAQAAIARVIEAADNPVEMAKKVKSLSDLSTVDPQEAAGAIHERLDYATLPASEQLLVDAAVVTLTQNLQAAGASVDAQLAALASWKAAAAAAADRVITVETAK